MNEATEAAIRRNVASQPSRPNEMRNFAPFGKPTGKSATAAAAAFSRTQDPPPVVAPPTVVAPPDAAPPDAGAAGDESGKRASPGPITTANIRGASADLFHSRNINS